MQQASVLDGVSFDPFSFKQNSLASAEVDVSRGEVGDALVISKVIVVSHELADLGFEVAGKIVVFQQDAVLQRLVPSLDLALGLGMQWGATNMVKAPVSEPFGEIASDIARPIVAQQSWPVIDLGGIEA